MTAWSDHPYHYNGYLYLLRPEVVFRAELDYTNTSTYGLYGSTTIWYLLYFDTVDIGDQNASTVEEGMTLIMGTTKGGDDLGRARVKSVVTEGYTGGSEKVIVVWASPNIHDGELYISDETIYIDVLDDRRAWFKASYYDTDGTGRYDGDQGPAGVTYNQFPIANAGPAYAQFVDDTTRLITVDFSGADSFVVAQNAVLGATFTEVEDNTDYITATSSTVGHGTDKLVDGTADYWEATSTAVQTILFHFTENVIIRKFDITVDGTTTAPRDLGLYALVDATNVKAFYIEDEAGWSAGETRSYEIDYDRESTSQWRLILWDNNGAAFRLRDVTLYGEDRDSVSPYTWDVKDGTITTGGATTEDITATFPLGFRHVQLTVEDTNSYTGNAYVPVAALPKRFERNEVDLTGDTPASSSDDGSHVAANAFDNDRSTYWQSAAATTTATLGNTLDSAQRVTAYGLVPKAGAGPPRDWTLQFYNTDTTAWVTLDTQTDQDWTPAEETIIQHSSTLATGTEALQHLPYTRVEADYTGGTASASSADTGYPASNAFDNSDATQWRTPAFTTTGYLQMLFPSGKTIVGYGIYSFAGGAHPVDWTVQGSNNGSDWDTLDTRSSEDWATSGLRQFTISAPASYTYYKLDITANAGGSAIYIAEWSLYTSITYGIPTRELVQYIEVPEYARYTSAALHLAKVGAPTDDLTLEIYKVTARDMTGAVLMTSAVVATSGLSTTAADTTFTFNTAAYLQPGRYALKLTTDGTASETDYVTWSKDGYKRYINGGMHAHINALTYSPTHYFALDDVSGTTVIESVAGDNGTASGVTWEAAGLGDGHTAATFDGVNDYITAYTAGMGAAFDETTGTIMMWLMPSGASWPENTYPLRLGPDSSNEILIKTLAGEEIGMYYIAGGTTKYVPFAPPDTNWVHIAATWDTSADEFKAYMNGVQQGETQTSLGTWAGALTYAFIGAVNGTPSGPFPGYIAGVGLFDAVLSEGQIAEIASAPTVWTSPQADAIFSLGKEDEQIYLLDTPVTADQFQLSFTDSNETYLALASVHFYEEHYPPVRDFEVIQHQMAQGGQQIAFRVYEDIPTSWYPEGTLALYWEREVINGAVGSLSAAGPNDREHMKFIGWLDGEPARLESTDQDTRSYVDLQCVDIGGRLRQMPMFPVVVERENSSTPSRISQVDGANMDRAFLYLFLRWFSTAAEVTDIFLSDTWDYWGFSVLSSGSGTLWDVANDRADAFAYILTCDKHGRLHVNRNPLLASASNRTSTVIVALDSNDFTNLDYTRTRTPRYHWQWSSAVNQNWYTGNTIPDADSGGLAIATFFAVAPGSTPGQGAGAMERGEQLVQNQSDLNTRAGNRYALNNAEQSFVRIEFAHAADVGLDPAKMEWVTLALTSAEAAQRGLIFATERFLPHEVTINHDHAAMTKSVTAVIEREITGKPAVEYAP